VVGFELPEHGETKGEGNNLNSWNFDALRELLFFAERDTREDKNLPLSIVAWSMGGLIATRMLQEQNNVITRGWNKVVLITPAVSTPILIGEAGIVTERTLTSNPKPPHNSHPPKPKSPLTDPIFALDLLSNSKKAWDKKLTFEKPILLLAADASKDKYVKTDEVIRWGKEKIEKDSANIKIYQCKNSYHEMDNEPGETGEWVRNAIARFLSEENSFEIPRSENCVKI
jgi:alpha-beta hydrolase superfamily lysophospholipase